MNRSFISVIAGGWGEGSGQGVGATKNVQGEMKTAEVDQVAFTLLQAKSVVIIPGYGMAVSRA